MTVPNVSTKVPGDNETVPSPIFWAKAKYDFAVDGGAAGAINLFPDVAIPNGSLALGAYINVLTALTSGGAATVALHVNSAGDIQAATDFDAAPFSVEAWQAAAALPMGADPVLLTADRNVVATIAAADLTAGAFEVLLAYLPPGL